jgi:8-oxo-dGTP diphosphatase
LNRRIFSLCVDGIYLKNGEILLLKRNVDPFKGFWHVVGGHVEENETLKEALQREFKEETNLDVEIGKILGSRIEKTSDRTKIVIIFKVNSVKGEIKLNSENTEYGWFHDFPSKIVYNYWKYI